MTEPYDSRVDTQKHINRVQDLLDQTQEILGNRAAYHDRSKLKSPEKEAFDEATPRLKELTYGSDEYKAELKKLGAALEHHYAHNSHHPEHYPNGVSGMSLLDVIEMLIDWKAASERHADGDIWSSIEKNVERFHLDPQLADILRNTAREMGW